MVRIGACWICGADHVPGLTHNTITSHFNKQFSLCESSECRAKHYVGVAQHELQNDVFTSYYFIGASHMVSIPRSNPVLPNPIGYVREGRHRESVYDFLTFKGQDPVIPVRWRTSGGSTKEKTMAYSKLARHNLVLPAIRIVPHSLHCGEELRALYALRNQELYVQCLTMNQGTFLPILSHALKSGMFAYLPIELVQLIIHSFYEHDEA